MYLRLDRLIEWLENRSRAELIDIHDSEWLLRNDKDPLANKIVAATPRSFNLRDETEEFIKNECDRLGMSQDDYFLAVAHFFANTQGAGTKI